MNVISLQNIEKSYGTRLLFKEVSMTFTTEKRLGLVGINGTGKSTFLKILAGQMEADKGTIERNGKASIYYLAQTPDFDAEATLLEAVLDGNHPRLQMVKAFERISREYRQMQESGKDDAKISRNYMNALEQMDQQDGWQVEQEARIILSKLGFPDVEQKVAMLSGGQKRRLALGQALLYPCDLLLLDEPTNHLDEDSIDWLESYLSVRQGGLLISTHDRYFLDSVCNGILELSNRHMYQYDGNYEDFIALKADREAREAATEEKRRQFLKREIEWVRRGALARTTKQKARLDRYEKLKNMEKTRRPDQMDPIALKTRLGKTIFDIEHLEFYFDERPMIKDFTYHVVRHDRIGIVGPNGVGKSTFMNILDGTYEATRGTIGKGETVRIAHFKQELPEFDEDMRVLDYIREDHSYMVLGDGSTLSAGQILERFLFTPELHGVPIRKLSGGERRRLYLLKLLMSAPNVLLLDEPTNDLDIPTLEVLEDFLDSFSGVIITVCHDRYFLDRVVDKLFVFTGDGHIEIVHGSYSDYKDALDESSGSKRPFYMPNDNIPANSKAVRAVEGGEADSDDSVDNQSNRLDTLGNDNVVAGGETDTFKEIPKKGLNKAEEAEYAQIMDELPKLEHLVKGLNVMMSQVATDYEKMQSLMEEREETQIQIDALTERWMELEERL
ncbi:MAG: ABC-F family ATP-binding cassette domain-containing protein [Veillonella parvula]|uniref:ABC-F family ATP-binding cassette domain-containing protein n=1 Tax=Veillonella parvula TaxID=29466 RepID=UPI00241D3429|nr:ABC-F family ATP-binding cassette domain-containing protein [Veillonella parvula]MBS5152229.1 ABC-F family ATP-binding cassette domain-containing protein [Veillonella parvula]MDU4415945.1 ABC-F family ATP-binding cassette domain-containing protein [Veillonella parvula]